MNKNLFINLSNHPSIKWSKKQLLAVNDLFDDDNEVEIHDIQFPQIDPNLKFTQIKKLANDFANDIFNIEDDDNLIVHVMGETSFVVAFVNIMLQNICRIVVSTTERKVVETTDENGNTIKNVVFEFNQFREIF